MFTIQGEMFDILLSELGLPGPTSINTESLIENKIKKNFKESKFLTFVNLL